MQILQEDPTYPEALIGRGTAYAFKRELDAAIADFTKVFKASSLVCANFETPHCKFFFRSLY